MAEEGQTKGKVERALRQDIKKKAFGHLPRARETVAHAANLVLTPLERLVLL